MRRYRVFAYGTLTFHDIAARVSGEQPAGEPALLHGHARHALRRRVYPGAVPRANALIDGVVYHGLSRAALDRIDAFEGELYRRQCVTVLAGEQAIPTRAFVYLLRARWCWLLLPHGWCPDGFRRDWHGHYLQRDDLGPGAVRAARLNPQRPG